MKYLILFFALCSFYTQAEIKGCMVKEADNYNPSAVVDIGICKFSGCWVPGDSNYSAEKITIYKKYLSEWENKNERHTSSVTWTNKCLDKLGCKNPAAYNFDSKVTKDNGKCKFKGCIDSAYEEYSAKDEKINDEFEVYKETFKTVVWENTCFKKKAVDVYGCLDLLADKKTPGATKEDGSCSFSGCFDENYKEYRPEDIIKNNWYKKYVLTYPTGVWIDKCSKAAIPTGVSQCEYIKKNGDLNKSGTITAADITKLLSEITAANGKYKKNLDFNFDGVLDAKDGDSLRGYILGTLSCQSVVEFPGCTNKNADNYLSTAKKDDDSCLFSFCRNSKYQEYDAVGNVAKLNAYDAYNLDPARKVVNASIDTCKNLKLTNPSPGSGANTTLTKGCTHKFADNYNSKAAIDDDSCRFTFCSQSGYVEYDANNNVTKMHAYDAYSSSAQRKQINAPINSCKTLKSSTPSGGHSSSNGLVINGCMNKLADNYNAKANKEDETCLFSFCSKSNYQEYDLAKSKLKSRAYSDYEKQAKIQNHAHIDTCKVLKAVSGAGKNVGSPVSGTNPGSSIGGVGGIPALPTPSVIKGCTNRLAKNYASKANKDDLSCVFAFCSDRRFKEFYLPGNIDVVEEYGTYKANAAPKPVPLPENSCKVRK